MVEFECFTERNVEIDKILTNISAEALFAVGKDGKLYGIGRNTHGQLGSSSKFKKDDGCVYEIALQNVVDIKGADFCTIALCETDDDITSKII